MTRRTSRSNRSKRQVVSAFRRRLVGVVAVLLAGFWPAADAHRMPGSLSTIKPAASGGHMEIIHRLHTSDAEEGLAAVLNDRTFTLGGLASRARLALYVEEKFVVAAAADGQIGAPLPLELVGAELDGEFVLVYQELESSLPAEIAVRDDILRDVFPGQVNLLNIAVDGRVRSLTFAGDDEWLTVKLD